jgi:hypothetical protein
MQSWRCSARAGRSVEHDVDRLHGSAHGRQPPLDGETPTIDIAVGYSKLNTSPVLKLFLSRLNELVRPDQTH